MRNALKINCLLAIILAANSLKSQTLGNAADLPFTMELEEVTQDELPGLHSFAFAKWDDWWVAVGGRINGLHGFFVATGFPEDKANVHIRMLNTETGAEIKFAVADLTVPFADALKSTNPQYAQSGEFLYITGGYGKSQTAGGFVTFPVLTVVNLPVLTSKMLAGENPSGAFQQIEVESLRVCGGEMEKLGDHFYLVGGHDFSGLYNQNGPPQFVQKYTSEIRKFKINHTASTLSVSDFSVFRDETNLHRRDFSLAPIVRPDGSVAIVLYGGVFRVGADLPFYNPITISGEDIFEMDAGYEQVFSQYTCPIVPIFDSADGSMYSIFFAGLSAHSFDEASGQLKYDEKVPFINDISVFRRQADGTSLEFLLPQHFDALLGANMIFVPTETAPQFQNEVFKLREMGGKTFVGHLFGGIKAEIPNLTPSSASNRMFKVFISPKPSVGLDWIEKGSELVKISPNPLAADGQLQLHFLQKVSKMEMFDAAGRAVFFMENPGENAGEAISKILEGRAAGICFLKFSGEEKVQVLKLVKG